MKRSLLVIAGVLLVAAAAWTGAWFWGKARLEAGIDARLAAFATDGRAAAYASRETGGFPFALETRLTGLEVTLMTGEGWSVTLAAPEAVARTPMLGRGEVTLDLPPLMRAELVRADDALPVDVESDGLKVIFLQAAEGDLEALISVESLTAVPAEPDPALFLGVEAGGIRTTLRVPQEGPPTTHSDIASIGLLASFPAVEGTRAVTVDWLTEGVSLTTQGTLRDAVDAEMLLSGFGSFVLAGQAGRSDLGFEVAAARAEDAFTLTLTQSRLVGSAGIEAGVLSLSGSAQETAAMLVQAAPAGKIEGAIALPRGELALRLPVVPGDEMTAFELALDLPSIMGDARLWETLDPTGRLQHDPGRLMLSLEGTARRLPPLGNPSPFEFGLLTINGAEARLLGADVSAAGEIEFVPPFNLPDGIVTVTSRHVMEAADALVRAGFIGTRERDLFLAIATQYSRQGADPSELVTEFDFGPTGVAANGFPVWSLD